MKKIIEALFRAILIYILIFTVFYYFTGANFLGFLLIFYMLFIVGGFDFMGSSTYISFPFAPLLVGFLPLFLAIFFIDKVKFIKEHKKKINIILVVALVVSIILTEIHNRILYPGYFVDFLPPSYGLNIKRCDSYNLEFKNRCLWQKAITLNNESYCDGVKLSEKQEEAFIQENCDFYKNSEVKPDSCDNLLFLKYGCRELVEMVNADPDSCRQLVFDYEQCYENHTKK